VSLFAEIGAQGTHTSDLSEWLRDQTQFNAQKANTKFDEIAHYNQQSGFQSFFWVYLSNKDLSKEAIQLICEFSSDIQLPFFAEKIQQ
jgi:hypothetical protein